MYREAYRLVAVRWSTVVHVFAAAHVHVKLQPKWWISRVTVQKSSFEVREERCERSRSWVQGDWLRPPSVRPLPTPDVVVFETASLSPLKQLSNFYVVQDTLGLLFFNCSRKQRYKPRKRELSAPFVLFRQFVKIMPWTLVMISIEHILLTFLVKRLGLSIFSPKIKMLQFDGIKCQHRTA